MQIQNKPQIISSAPLKCSRTTNKTPKEAAVSLPFKLCTFARFTANLNRMTNIKSYVHTYIQIKHKQIS